jgi:hypothetical protein
MVDCCRKLVGLHGRLGVFVLFIFFAPFIQYGQFRHCSLKESATVSTAILPQKQ